MNSIEIFKLIEQIAATPGKNDKEALLKQGLESCETFARVCKFTYDPFITFGLRGLPEGKGVGTMTLESREPWDALLNLSARALTGDAARERVRQLLDEQLDRPSAELVRRIINKNLRAGFTEGTINRVKPGSIAEFAYMRCSLGESSNMPKWDWSDGKLSQEKADGMFANVEVFDGLYVGTRQGSVVPLDNLPELAKALEETFLNGTQTHGEMVVFKDGKVMPREESNGVMNSILNGGTLDAGQEVHFFAWDQVPLVVAKMKKAKCQTPYKNRFTSVAHQVRDVGSPLLHVIPSRLVKSKAEATEHFLEMLKAGKEGTVVKDLEMIWKDGTSKDQVKFKAEADVDLRVLGFNMGRVGTKLEGRVGGLNLGSECGVLKVDVAIKGEGMRASVEAEPEKWLRGIVPVRFNTIMPADKNGVRSLFLPRLVEAAVRVDKTAADTMEQIEDIYNAVIAG